MERVQTKLQNSKGRAGEKGVVSRTIRTMQLKEQSFEKTEQPWEQTQGEVDQVMGSRIGPKEKGTKEAWVVWNKELTWGSGPEADSYGTRSEGGVSKATQIGNCVGIENRSGIDWEWCQSLDHEGEGSAGAEGRWNEWGLDWRS